MMHLGASSELRDEKMGMGNLAFLAVMIPMLAILPPSGLIPHADDEIATW